MLQDNGKIDLRKVRLEIVLPALAAVLCSLLLCGFSGKESGFFISQQTAAASVDIPEEEPFDFPLYLAEVINDPVLEYFRNPEYKDWVINFFTDICSNREIAQVILENCDRFSVSPALAFALCWEESRFNPRAINRHNRDGSIDRGLFQLNNRSFPNLEIILFFDINANVYYGISHLRFCLDSGGSEISALAMYNAGTGRVRTGGTPFVTLNYASRIMNNKSRIESLFHSRLIREEEKRIQE